MYLVSHDVSSRLFMKDINIRLIITLGFFWTHKLTDNAVSQWQVTILKSLHLHYTCLKKIIWVTGVLRRTVVSDWRLHNLCGSHLKSQVVALISWKFKNSGERFDWSIVAVGKRVMWLAVKTCAEIGYVNRRVVKWINNALLFPVNKDYWHSYITDSDAAWHNQLNFMDHLNYTSLTYQCDP